MYSQLRWGPMISRRYACRVDKGGFVSEDYLLQVLQNYQPFHSLIVEDQRSFGIRNYSIYICTTGNTQTMLGAVSAKVQ